MHLDKITLWQDRMPRDAALNMALDEVMLLRAAEPWLRVYRWAVPSVSIGFSQNANVVPEEKRTWSIVRRWTGGGVVVHDDDWTYTIGIPANHPLGSERTSETYRWIHEAIIAALSECGIGGCTLQAESTTDGMGVCFVEPARFDVLRDGIKIAGAAQRRAKSGLLHQGSVQPLRVPTELGMSLARRLAREVTIMNQHDAESNLLNEAAALAAAKYAQTSWLLDRRATPTP